MNYTVVTSIYPKAWEDGYAKRFVNSFLIHWPKEVKLVVVHEFDAPPEFGPEDRIEVVPESEVDDLQGFLAAVNYFPLLRGELSENKYSIVCDARMARKAFIERWAVNKYGGKVFWVDCDVVTHEDVTTEWLDSLLPDDMLACFLGREDCPIEHLRYTESGFLGYNAAHELTKPFLREYVSIFRSGTFVTIPVWHDCVAFDMARQAFDQHLPGQFNNLGEGVNAGPSAHVFINSVLGGKMDHLKGNRKKLPRSPKADLTVERTEAHWQ